MSGTNEKLFGPSLVLLRISFGLMLASFGFDLSVDVTNPNLFTNAFSSVATTIVAHESGILFVPILLIATCFVLGLFTKPASIALIVILAVIDIAMLPLATVSSLLWPQMLIVSVSLMAIAGGLGNALGLNGLILRNIKNPGAFVKFLFS